MNESNKPITDEEWDKILNEGTVFKKVYSPNRPLLVPSKLITMEGLSKHLLGVYISLLYMFNNGIGDIRLVGMESNRFETNLQELIELGLVRKDEDGTLNLLEVC